MLSSFLLDGLWIGDINKAMKDTVQCAICGQTMTYINNRHLAKHDISADEYKKRFPSCPLKSEEVSQRLSARSVAANASRKGRPRTEEEKTAIRNGIANSTKPRGPSYVRTEATRKLLSETLANQFRDGRVHHLLGKSLPEEVRQKISKSLKGRKVGPEAALKALATKRAKGYDFGSNMRGKSMSDEARAKISEANRLRFSNTRPATRAYMAERIDRSDLILLNEISSDRFELRCRVCSYEFTRTPQCFTTSKWSPRICDQCFPISPVSEAEKEIALFCEGFTPIIRSDMESIAPLELDILIPETRLAFEYCGLYWHSELAGKTRWYHRKKMENCSTAGIRLITIFEDEWINTPDIVRSMIANLLGKSSIRIPARKCAVETISAEEATIFLNTNHLQGRGRSKVKYGLKYDGELVAVMTFMDAEASRRRVGWEINRFAVKCGHSIPGGASKLFSAFLREYEPDEVVSYADLRWGTGAVYGHLGFENEGNTVPNYWYFRPNEMKRYHRYGLRKNKDDLAEKTEWQIRQDDGWNRIWDCGHAKWVWRK